MIKLLYITNGVSGAGGLERVLSVKASYLADHLNYEVHILSLNECGKEKFYEFSPKIILHTIAVSGGVFWYLKKYVGGIKRIVNNLQPDVISVCDDGLKAFLLPTILRNPCPMVYERHVSKLISRQGNRRRRVGPLIVRLELMLMDLLAKTYDSFVVLTNGNKQEWKSKNLCVIPNPNSFYPVVESKLDDKKVIAVGKQGFQKGYDLLLRAWQQVNHRHPDWRLEIYGKINLDQKLKEQAEGLKVGGSVFFYPPERDIVIKYLQSSIFVMSSRFEGFGMVLIEAMACGLPCVSFDCPHGPSDIISQGRDGFLVENGDVEALAQKIITLMESDFLRRGMGATARENAKKYMPDVIVPKWDSLFNELIYKRAAKSGECAVF